MYKKISKTENGSDSSSVGSFSVMSTSSTKPMMKSESPAVKVLPPLPRIPPTEDVSSRKSVVQERSKDKVIDKVIAEPDVEAGTSVMFEVGRRMIRLYLCDDHCCKACLNNFTYIASAIEKYYASVTEKLLQTGFMELFQQVLRRCFKKALTETDDKSSNGVCMSVMLAACSAVIIMTDVSSEACRKAIQLELHVDIINSLRSDRLDPKQRKESSLNPTLCGLVDQLMSVLYNVIQLIPEAAELYRDQGIVEVIQRFRTGTTDSLSCFTLMLLLYVSSDKENVNLKSNDHDFSFLNAQLKSSSLDKANHRSYFGHKAVEIMAAINKLIVSDANKKRFFKSGVLSSYLAFLEPQFHAEEQLLVAQGLRILSSKFAEEIKKEKSCVERLESLLKKSENDGVRSQVNGVLIALGVKKEENPIQASKTSTKEDEVENGTHKSQQEVAAPSASHVSIVEPEVSDSGATCEPEETVDASTVDPDGNESEAEEETVVMETTSTSYSVTTMAGVFFWTKPDVREWFERNQLQHLIKWFDGYDGRMMLEFQYQLEKYPQLLVPHFIADNSVRDFLRLVMALRTLP